MRSVVGMGLAIVGALCVVQLTGCASTEYSVSVSALAANDAETQRRYLLIPGNEGVSEDDLEFQEFAAYLHRALEAQQFVRAEDPRSAEILIVALYDIGDPETRVFAHPIPQWGQTGVSSSRTYGSVTSSGSLSPSGSYSGTSTYQGMTYHQPVYGITGFSSGVGTYTTFTRSLQLFAFQTNSVNPEEPRELWRLTAVSVGSSGDLRKLFPIMVAAARPYLGKRTDATVHIRISESDRRIAAIRAEAGRTPESVSRP